MKLLYATTLTFPSGLANRLQILNMSKEFQKRLNNNFILGISRMGEFNETLDRYLDKLNLSAVGPGRSIFVSLKYLKYIKKNKITHVYCREPRLQMFFLIFKHLFFLDKIEFIYEMHEIKRDSFLSRINFWLISKFCDYIVFITKNLKDAFIKRYNYGQEKSIVAHDGVDLAVFDIDLSRQEAQKQYGLPINKKILGFFGRFKTMGMDKGLEVIFRSLKKLDDNVILLAMGGKPKDISFYKNMADGLGLNKRVIFTEHLNQNEVAGRQKACDALLMPFPFNEHYAYYMSPLKMFEYMASQRPIVATDLPSVREVLNEKNAILVRPDDPEKLAEGIKKVLESKDLSREIAKQAYSDVKKYTWEKRAGKVISFMER